MCERLENAAGFLGCLSAVAPSTLARPLPVEVQLDPGATGVGVSARVA